MVFKEKANITQEKRIENIPKNNSRLVLGVISPYPTVTIVTTLKYKAKIY